MEKRQIQSWITIKHHHIPIFEGENTQDAINRFKEGVRKGKQTAPIPSKQYIKKRDAAEKAVNALEQHQKRVDSANERIKTDTSAEAQKEKLNADRTFKEAMQRYSTRKQAFDAIKDKKHIKSYEFRKKQVDKELSEKQDQISRTSHVADQMNTTQLSDSERFAKENLRVKDFMKQETGQIQMANGQVLEKNTLKDLKWQVQEFKQNGTMPEDFAVSMRYSNGDIVSYVEGDDTSKMRFSDVTGIILDNPGTLAYAGSGVEIVNYKELYPEQYKIHEDDWRMQFKEKKKKYDDYDKKAIDTLIVQGPDGKMHIERYRGQDLDTYPHFAEVNHDKLVDIKSNGGKWNEAAMNGIAIKDIYDYLGKEFNFNDGKPLEIKTEPPKPKEPEYERTPKMDWLDKRIEGKQTELNKLEKKMERINKAKESDYKENNPYYYSDYDFRSTTKDIERAKADIEKYKQDMETEISKAKSRNVPVITEFLNDWEQKSIEYFTKEEQVYRKKHQEEYVPQMKKYSTWLDDHSGFRWGTDEEKAKYKAMYKEEDEYSKNFKNYWKFVTQFYDGQGTWEENMRKAVAREKVAKYDDIITRTNDLIGQITDAGGLHIGKKGDLNGVIIGSKGKATVETIGAGGYNIQRYHFRTLIHELKEKK